MYVLRSGRYSSHTTLSTDTSSVAYCSPPIAILVSDFDVTYYPSNSTLEFDLSAASIQDNLNVSVALSVNAYGIGVFDVNIALCEIAGGILCPLPKYQFSGGGVFPVPEQVGSQIPQIAYNIPDLEAVTTLQLTDTSNNQVVGCVQATLSNGHTARQRGALWASVGLALLAFFSSLMHTAVAQSIGAAQWRVVDVMLAIQQPAITSLLSLNYPVVFLEYGTNFAWSLGLVNIPSLQDSITRTRTKTGGHDEAVFGKNLTAQTGRKYNPFSSTQSASSSGFGRSIDPSSLGFLALPSEPEGTTSDLDTSPTKSFAPLLSSYAKLHDAPLAKRQQYAPNTGPGGSLLKGGNGVSLPLVTGNASIDGGIGTFSERNYVAPGNAFLTVLVSMVILLAIVVGAILVVYALTLFVRALTDRRQHKGGLSTNLAHWSQRSSQRHEFLNIVIMPTLGRYFLVIVPIFFIFAFWQWVGGDSWVGHLVAAIFLVLVLACLGLFFYPMFRHVRRTHDVHSLYHQDVPPAQADTVTKRWGHMAHPYRPKFYWFAFALAGWWFIRACFISFAQGHGTRQAIGLLVAEVILFIALCVLRTGRDKKSDFVMILLCFTRIAAWAVCIAFIPAANVRTIPRAVVAYVLLVVTAVPIIFLFFLTVYDLITPFLKRNRRDVQHAGKDVDMSQNTEAVSLSSHQQSYRHPSTLSASDDRDQVSTPHAS